MNSMTCVIRNVAGLDQYIPINDAYGLKVGERAFTGSFRNEIEHDGPSRSHARTICLPLSQPTVEHLSAERIRSFGK